MAEVRTITNILQAAAAALLLADAMDERGQLIETSKEHENPTLVLINDNYGMQLVITTPPRAFNPRYPSHTSLVTTVMAATVTGGVLLEQTHTGKLAGHARVCQFKQTSASQIGRQVQMYEISRPRLLAAMKWLRAKYDGIINPRMWKVELR